MHLMSSLLVQELIQAVLLSDGQVSFAAFIYDDPEAILAARRRVVGFDAGDELRSDVILELDNSDSDFSPEERMIYRIDGRAAMSVHLCCVQLFLLIHSIQS